MKAETASDAVGTQIRLSAAFADAVALMAKKANDAAVQYAEAKLKKKQVKCIDIEYSNAFDDSLTRLTSRLF